MEDLVVNKVEGDVFSNDGGEHSKSALDLRLSLLHQHVPRSMGGVESESYTGSGCSGGGKVNKEGSMTHKDDGHDANGSGDGSTVAHDEWRGDGTTSRCGVSVAVMSCKADVISGSVDAVGGVPCSKVKKEQRLTRAGKGWRRP